MHAKAVFAILSCSVAHVLAAPANDIMELSKRDVSSKYCSTQISTTAAGQNIQIVTCTLPAEPVGGIKSILPELNPALCSATDAQLSCAVTVPAAQAVLAPLELEVKAADGDLTISLPEAVLADAKGGVAAKDIEKRVFGFFTFFFLLDFII